MLSSADLECELDHTFYLQNRALVLGSRSAVLIHVLVSTAIFWPSRAQVPARRKESTFDTQKQAVRRVVGFVPVAIAEAIEHAAAFGAFAFGYL